MKDEGEIGEADGHGGGIFTMTEESEAAFVGEEDEDQHDTAANEKFLKSLERAQQAILEALRELHEKMARKQNEGKN